MKTIGETQNLIQEIEEATGVKPAITYVSFIPQKLVTERAVNVLSSDTSSGIYSPTPQDQLELVLITSKGGVIRKRVEGATREKVIEVANNFRSQITNVRSKEEDYLAPAKQLYDWIIAPLEEDIKAQGIQNLSFIVDTGLRSIPFAALHDGKQFMIEKYSIGLMPSLSLTDTRYKPIKNLEVLAMGADSFSDQKPLPGVPVELSAITPSLWEGKSFLNDGFTIENLKNQRKNQPFGIIHLATHANFLPGEVSNSYIQLWNSKLTLNQLSSLGWNNPPVELLVLSACRTALGNEEAELGFAGLAVQAGVKSALGSLWYVSDRGTLGLMTEFYQELKQAPTKSEALRQTQVAMLQGKVYISGGKLMADSDAVPLPPELAKLGDQNFKHPYFWSAFTMIGNPW
ncbi:MAG TPA: CHAT domain-containing protein [Cyanobacteria bacterium UBA11149]|nr:CHAT domain-containing protein [Cyanobacteria bacterium UBA11366]HBK62017.1 CHAT domain-containing protein [Cyanobacteria bacterium UBA11166]HBW92136.1 CHAT domain-containing protein [Cyanobacteria bacterium UBA11149]